MKTKKLKKLLMSAYMKAQIDLGYDSDYDKSLEHAESVIQKICKHPYKYVVRTQTNDDVDYCKKCNSRI